MKKIWNDINIKKTNEKKYFFIIYMMKVRFKIPEEIKTVSIL